MDLKALEELRATVSRTGCNCAGKPECDSYRTCNEHREALLDELGAEYEDQMLGERNIAYNSGFDAGFASADDWLAQHEDAMAEHGWVRLPKDADGEYIHIGDVMEWCNGSFTVHELKLTEDGWQTWDGEHGYTVHADECRHHHAPTVEDVLREFGDWYAHTKGGCDEEGIVAEYAKRLKLAEGEDE